MKGTPFVNLSDMRPAIESRLSGLGYRAEIISTEPSLVIRLRTLEVVSAQPFPWLNAILFGLTVLTTLAAGALQENVDWVSNPRLLVSDPMAIVIAGLPFSVSLLAILLFHEFGHYIASRIHGVNVSLPYFIPAPTFIGTFGAVIKSRSAFMNRRQLLDVGATGPLSGLVVSIVVLVIGISTSAVRPIPEGAGVYFGDPLLSRLITYVVKGPIPDGQALFLSSVGFAGWVGLLVTMLNLLPIGQLDGGHIMYALFGKRQRVMAYIVILALVGLSFLWSGWIVWLIMAMILRPAHPPTLLDEIALGPGRRIVGYLSILAFLICFIPVPISAG